MAFPMQPGRTIGSGGDVPNIVNLPVDAANSFPKGQILRLQADGELETHPGGATVVDIYGVSLESVTLGVTPGPAAELAVAKADRNTEFVARVHDGGVFGAPLPATMIVGAQFGFLNDAAGISYVDEDDVANVVLQLTKVDANLRLVWFKFLESALQEP